MRVAHFVQRYPPALGGSEAFFARLSRHLAGAGDTVTVFTTAALDLEAFWSPRARCLPPGRAQCDGVEVRRYLPRRWPGRRHLLKALSFLPHRQWQCLTMPCNPICPDMWSEAGRTADQFDIVHATAFPYAFPIACALRLARRQKVPFVLTPFLHLGDPDDPDDRTRRAYLTPALRSLIDQADAVFVQTGVERNALATLGTDSRKLILLGMGVNPSECTGGDRERARREWGVGGEEIVIGHLANLSVEKGSVDLLKAVERCWARSCRFRLVLAGPEMPNFRSFWETFGDADRVRRLGVLSEDQKRDFFAGIDLFALPSRSDSFGLVILEAWANGIPSVAYRAGGVAGVIRHEQDGLLVRCGDVDGLAHALAHSSEDGGARRRLGACGRRRVATEFRWPDKLNQVRSVYLQLTAPRDRAMQPTAPIVLAGTK